MKDASYRRFGCKMGCGSYKCKNDTPPSGRRGGQLTRKIMKHINKIRQLRWLSKEVEEDMKK
jgi:hypothetical protein